MPNVTKLSRSMKAAITNLVTDIPIEWKITAGISPIESIVNGIPFFQFSSLDTQEIYTEVTLPNNYVGGTLVSLLNGIFYTSEVAGNVLFKTEATLIRPSLTVQGIYPSNEISVNAQIPVSAVSKEFTSIDAITLTDGSGAIGGVTLQAKDRIRIRLYRDIGSEAPPCNGDVFLMQASFNVKAS